MKKIIVFIITISAFFVFPQAVHAQESADDFRQTKEYGEIVDQINEALDSATDDEVAGALDEQDITIDKAEGVSGVSVIDVIKNVISSFGDALKSPIIMLGKIIAVTILCAMSQSMAPEGSGLVKTFKLIGVLCSITVMYDTIYSSFELINTSLNRMSEFMIAYIPIFSSVSAASGSVVTGGSYYAITLALCEIIAVVSSKVLMPFLSIILAVSLVAAINPELNFCGVAESIKKCVTWILGGMMTIFTGLLTLQSITGTAADTLTTRTMKFAASSFIPLVGGAVSEAYSTVYGSMGVIRSGTGVIGIIAICIIVLKPILAILAIKFIITIATIINDLFDQKECSQFLKSTNAVMSMGLGIVVCFSLIFIIATAVLMMTAMNLAA